MLTDLTVKVEHVTYDFDQKLVDFVKQLSGAVKTGWNPTQTLPVLLSASMADLIPALEEVSKLSGEATENLQGFLRAHLNSSLDLAVALGVVK